jgi:hypothetical protein
MPGYPDSKGISKKERGSILPLNVRLRWTLQRIR